jgi:hypothetical protein
MSRRSLLRREAKKIYKRETKKVPKSQRMPFSEFYKRFKNKTKSSPIIEDDQEDFNLDDFINDTTELETELEPIEAEIKEEEK